MEVEIRQPSADDEVLEFLVSGPSPQAILDFRPSSAAQERLRQLIQTNREGTLTALETAELDAYQLLEHFMRRLKIKALIKLQS
jgi:hypothetical protein